MFVHVCANCALCCFFLLVNTIITLKAECESVHSSCGRFNFIRNHVALPG